MWWLAATASAGVWVREPGAGWAQVAVVHQQAERIYLPPGGADAVPLTDEALLGTTAELFEGARFAATDLVAYGELGLGHGLEVYGSLPVRYAQTRFVLARGDYPPILSPNAGLGDAGLGLRLGRTWGGLAASARLGATLPLYDNRPAALNVEAGNADIEDDHVPLGQGSVDVEVGGGVGYGFGRGWVLAEVAARFRTAGFSTAIPARLQVGANPSASVSLWVGAALVPSLGDGAAPDDYRDVWGKGPLVVDHQSSLTVEVGGIGQVGGGWGVSASLSRAVWGARFPALTAGTVGVTRAFSLGATRGRR